MANPASNPSGINPAGHRILVLPREIQGETESGIVLATDGQKEREQMSNTTGVVIAMGDTCYTEVEIPWCQPGDKVAFAKYSGLLYKGKDGMTYRMFNDGDITAVLDSDVELVDPWLVTKRVQNV
jgi:co-chaperonin GroES (HSP10)